AVMVAVLVHALVPMARARMAERQEEIAENVTAQFLIPGLFQYPAPGITLFIREISPTGELRGLFLEDARRPDAETSYSAEEALILRGETGPVLIMIDGMVQVMRVSDEGPRLSVTRFEEMTYDLAAIVGSRAGQGRDLRDYSTARLLMPDAPLLEATGASPGRARLEAHQRLAQPLLAPVAAMLGFATLMIGSFSRFGVWRQIVWAVVGLILVQLLSNWAANRAGESPDGWPLVYLPALIGAAICAGLLWLAARPRRGARAGTGTGTKDRNDSRVAP
ncbi:MAG: LptF/LptG family permease, partial [Paracoccus sp. (in: a-proteobacteria)]|nr:LptF/LptG family permease [Paracoccus sp. (in: a-proteobacteria)]